MPKYRVYLGDPSDPSIEVIEAQSFITDQTGNLIFTSKLPKEPILAPSYIFTKDYWYKAYRMDDLRKL